MTHRSLSFDDEEKEELCVFSGYDLILAHHDEIDLDWHEVAERSTIDECRGLVIAQVAVLEDLIDEFLVYLEDPTDTEAYQRQLDRKTVGPRLELLERELLRVGLLDQRAADLMTDLRAGVKRRNQLAHGTIDRRYVPDPSEEHPQIFDVDWEWVLIDRRSHDVERISMAGLRHDVYDSIGVFTAMLAYTASFVEHAPRPAHFAGGMYLDVPAR
jgi:hypothetical protein